MRRLFPLILVAGILTPACGGSSPSAEPPETMAAPPAAEASAMPEAPAPASSAGEHTMPDGSKMPGEMHDK